MRFVLLYHEMPEGSERRNHWDLMFEDPVRVGGKDPDELRLWTWSIEALPTGLLHALNEPKPESRGDHAAEIPNQQKVSCSRLANHRAAYLTYEGEISNGRGHVRQMEAGEFQLLQSRTNAQGCIEKLVIKLSGRQIRGRVLLELEKDDRWKLSWSE